MRATRAVDRRNMSATGLQVSLVTADLSSNRSLLMKHMKWLHDTEVTKYLDCRNRTWTEGLLLRWSREISANKHHTMRYIFSGGGPVGTIKASVHPLHGHAEIGYMLGERYTWGCGVATEALRQMVALLDITGVNDLFAGVYGGHAASQKVLEKNGFAECCRMPNKLLLPSGKRDDHVWYRRTSDGQ